ncbi:MAG: hypothetical protein DRI70_02335 [Bacteroidetes bacterium]|nr:MAG: hypothetical protein DRI70_02335 [Bacteroidota bacterium]
MFISDNLLFSQKLDLKLVESELISEFQNYRSSAYEIVFDSLRSKLRFQVEKIVSDPRSYEYRFDSLSNHIKIIRSKDGKVRIFSWDELTGGTWHDMAVIVQFRDNDKINTQWIDSDISEEPNGLTDAIQFAIYDIQINEQPHYLCFGWGTYGSGHHHNSILIFSIENNSIKVCSSCIEEEYVVILAPRTEKINLQYDEGNKIISFDEFSYDDEIGFFKRSGGKVNLKLEKGKFHRYGG